MDNRRRAQIRTQMRELTSLVIEWDPAALVSTGAPTDEYECLVGPLPSRLSEGRSPRELGEWLRVHVRDHFGSANPDTEEFARRVTDWYRVSRRGAV